MKRTFILRWLPLLLVLALAAVLAAGCGSGGGGTGNQQGQAPQTKEQGGKKQFVVGWSTDTVAQPWRAYLTETVKNQWATKHPEVKLIVTDAQGKTEKQISDLEDLAAQKVDLIMVSPKEEKGLTATVKKINDSGIPVVLVDRGVEGEDFTARVKVDNVELGRMVAEYMAKKLNGKGNVVIIEGVPGASTVLESQQGFVETMKKYPDIKILASQPADYRRDKAMQVMENYLQAYPKIDGVYTHADEMTMGALLAAKNAGREKEIIWGSINSTMELIKEIKDGNIVGATPLRSNTAKQGVEIAWKILNGEKVPKVTVVPGFMVDETNAAKVYDANRYSLDPWPPDEQK